MAAKKKSASRKKAAQSAGKVKAKKLATAKRPAPKRKTKSVTKKKSGNGQRRLHLMSDFTGNLANHLVSSVLSQYPDTKIKKVFHLFLDDPKKLEKAIRKIRSSQDLVCHALVDPDAKQSVTQHCQRLSIPALDLTGTVSQFFSTHLDQTPQNDITALHKIDGSYFKRIDAMEFTLQHDDSRRLDTMDQADVVLLGISRVSKSPTSTFLGSLGLKTGNVSIAPSLGLPKELKKCKGKVVALTMQPQALYEIRQRRFEINGFSEKMANRDELSIGYLKPRDVAREVMDAESLYRKNRIPMVDVTGMTIEESAAHVLEALKLIPVA